jgi:hypothetical protein
LIATWRFSLPSRAIDLAHPACPDEAEDVVRAEAGASGQGHSGVRPGLYGETRRPHAVESARALAGPEWTCQLFEVEIEPRMRWEYVPGSELFVVYSDGRDTALGRFPWLQNRSFAVKMTRLLRF